MIRTYALFALGLGFVIMGLGLLALTRRKPSKAAPAVPNKSQLREQAELAAENKKMKIAGGCVAGFGLLVILFSLI